jgi:hypothetical protein
MDRFIRETLQEQAETVTVSDSAWSTQRARLGQPRTDPLRRRMTVAMEVMAACAVVGLILLVGLRPGGRLVVEVPSRTPRQAEGEVADPNLNPHVKAPSREVLVSPGLPIVTPPAGFISQAQAQAKGLAALQARSQADPPLLLNSVSVEGAQWVLHFTPLLPSPARFHGGPRRDPIPVTQQTSDVAFVGEMTIGLDGRTGEYFSLGTTGGALGPAPAILEHYRGRIVDGGGSTTLRLVNPDGSREGRDLQVWVPQEAIDAGKAQFYQLLYGAGQQADVWSTTVGDGVVVAYKISLADPIAESLAATPLYRGIPVYPSANQTDSQVQASYKVGASRETVLDWYLTEMPRYGWHLTMGVPRSAEGANRLTFQNAAWSEASVVITEKDGGVEITLGLTDAMAGLPKMDAQAALDQLFAHLAGDATFKEFPRTPTWRDVMVNIGGQWPGEEIPVRFESVVSPLGEADWYQVLLVRKWEASDTRWTWRVGPSGQVLLLDKSGAELIPYR